MTLPLTLSGLHLHRPSLAGLRRVVHYAVPAAVEGWLVVGAIAAVAGYGLHFAVVSAVALPFATYRAGVRAGERRATRVMAVRHREAMAGVGRIAEAMREEAAYHRDGLALIASSDAVPHAATRDGYMNARYSHADVSTLDERSGR